MGGGEREKGERAKQTTYSFLWTRFPPFMPSRLSDEKISFPGKESNLYLHLNMHAGSEAKQVTHSMSGPVEAFKVIAALLRHSNNTNKNNNNNINK
jgi:hypothetical protein